MGVVLAIVLAPLAICLPQAAASSPKQVVSFGENIWGQLGNDGYVQDNPTPNAVALPSATGSPVQVAVGEDHSIVLTSGGQIYTFGTGGLGSGNRFSEFRTPVAITLPGATGSPVQAAAGVSFSLVSTASGQLYTFGYNAVGQLGDGKSSYEEDPTPEAITLPGATGSPTEVAAGREFSLVLTSSGQLYAFGGDSHGELGNDNPFDFEGVSTPEAITLPGATGSPVQIAAGEYHSLVLTSTGQLYTFGDDHSGQLGNGKSDNESHPTPEAITLPGAAGPIVQVAAGWEFSLALTSTGQLYAFGNDEYGQLGNGKSDTESHPTPEAITLAGVTGSIREIAAGKNHSLVVTSSGELYAFGSDQYGQLGNGKTEETPYSTPTLVLSHVKSVARGSSANHVLAIVPVPPPPLDVSTTTLPEGKQGAFYSATATATGGTPPLHWTATGLPSGLRIDAHSGQIRGIPTVAGNSTVTLTATDAEGVTAESTPITLVIAAACGHSRDSRCNPCSSRRVRCCTSRHGEKFAERRCRH
jgi:alpha-tubulin suppressor-like RCC1 family protein